MESVTAQQIVDLLPYISVPSLALTVLGFVLAATRRAVNLGAIDSKSAGYPRLLVAAWAVWGLASADLALSGRCTSDAFYALLPGLWTPFIPVLIFAVFAASSSRFREALDRLVEATPLHWLVYFQALRISAVGTAFETAQGRFPESFELFVGVPDLLFGISALYVGRRVRAGSISERAVALWSLIGFLVIVPAAPLVAQMGLPGFVMLFPGEPSAEALYVYPMVLAPTLIVPLFVLFNLLTALRIWRQPATQTTASADATRAASAFPHQQEASCN